LKQIKIGEVKFDVLEGKFFIKTTLNYYTSYFIFDTKTNPSYINIFNNIFDSGKLFNIESTEYFYYDCLIKSVDIDYNKNILEITIRTKRVEDIDRQAKRSELINNLLDSKENFDTNI
jgi:hypothetical protein